MTDVNDPLMRHLRTVIQDDGVSYGKPLLQVLVEPTIGRAHFRYEAAQTAPRTHFIRYGDAVAVFQVDYVVEQPEMMVEVLTVKQMAFDSAFKEMSE